MLMAKPLFEMSVEGMKELQKAFSRYANEILRATEVLDSVTKSGIEIGHRAKKILNDKIYNTPPSPYYRRTGMLRANTKGDTRARIDGSNIVTTVRSKQHYAKYIEFGTSRMRARPFLAPAVAHMRIKTISNINEGVFKFLRNRRSKI